MLSAMVGAASNGLYSTLSPTTLTGQWVGYQIFNGVGRGMGMQMVSGSRSLFIIIIVISY
jgi:hypothetical protein